jgi:hypothetical protein
VVTKDEHILIHKQVGKKHIKKIKRKVKRKFICEETGEVFNRIVDAAKKFNVRSSNVCMCLHGKLKSLKKLHFKFIEE